MKRMLLIALLAVGLGASAQTDYYYNVQYKCGPIAATAAHGHVSLATDDDGTMTATLSGHSKDWGGRIYTVCDTLQARISGSGTEVNEDLIYLGGCYTKPRAGQEPAPGQFRTISGLGDLSVSGETLEALSMSADMLSLYGICPRIDFDALEPGHVMEIPIATEDGPRQLQISYFGPTYWRGNKAWSFEFRYTYDGSLCAWPVTCIVDAATGLPVSFAADLRIGALCMELVQ